MFLIETSRRELSPAAAGTIVPLVADVVSVFRGLCCFDYYCRVCPPVVESQ